MNFSYPIMTYATAKVIFSLWGNILFLSYPMIRSSSVTLNKSPLMMRITKQVREIWSNLFRRLKFKFRMSLIRLEDLIFHNRDYVHYWTHDDCTRRFKNEKMLDNHINQTTIALQSSNEVLK